DRALPSDWISLVQDQVNITPSGTGDVSFLLKPPVTAEPASYPFTVSVGPFGQPLTPYGLTLAVQAAPAVKLKAKSPKVVVGPIARVADFGLTVESAGNADTAYRVGVKDTQVDKDEHGRPRGPDDVYDTPTWRYLFDRELDTLQAPQAGRLPVPQEHTLKICRKGVWWLGWKESHTVHVKAIPVTDMLNGGKSENTAVVTAVRWRIFPLPWFLMVPLAVVALVLLGSGASNFRVPNAYQTATSNFIIGDEVVDPGTAVNMPVQLDWDAPLYALLSVRKNENGEPGAPDEPRADSVSVNGYGNSKNVAYSVGPRFFGTRSEVRVNFVPWRTQGMFQVASGADESVLEGVLIEQEFGGGRKLKGREITLQVPADGSPVGLIFRNLTTRRSGLTIVAWEARKPAGFSISGFIGEEGFREIGPQEERYPKIRYTGQGGAEQIWELLTTDAQTPLLRIKLKVSE
ncbi:MAG TPA: hypothetical protein VM328_03390, partial [Fimbriimonadaceae bacterium]|nr:hypothetical protein [Fimbriimonadaceae bacterium]